MRYPLFPPVNAAGGAGFGDDDFGELGELGFEAVPDPDGDVFAGGVFEARDVVEIAVVELFPERFEGVRDVRVIHDPAELGIAFAVDDDFGAEAVAMEAAAFVALGQMREEMGGFELKRLTELEFDGK